MNSMAVKKVSIALNEDVAQAAATAARTEGVSLSAWVNAAAERALKVSDGLAALAEWEAEFGSLTKEERSRAQATFDGDPDA